MSADTNWINAGYTAPILYMKMTDASTAATNSGSGGDGTLNGVVATSGRGPNQYNSPACTFDGSADYLLKTGLTGSIDSKEFTLSMAIKFQSIGRFTVYKGASGNDLEVELEANGKLTMAGNNSAGASVMNISCTATGIVLNKWYSIQIAVDAATTTHDLWIDGVEFVGTKSPNTLNNDSFGFAGTDVYIGQNGVGAYDDPIIGDYWWDDSYLDLSTSNPFYDTDTGKPKYLGSQGELPTGSQPLIYLPLRGDDAGNNLGSGGDFTVNSGPYTGARGPSENWEQAISVDGTNYLTKAGGIFCQSLVKWKSIDSGVTWTATYTNSVTVTDIGNGTDNGYVAYYFGTSENITWDEANQLRFTDAFGYPLPMPIDANTVLALDFSNPANRGENLGTGGDYTVTGTPVDVGSLKG